MMRPVLAFLSLLALTAPIVAAADPAPFEDRQGCRLVGVPLDLPECSIQHAGTVTWVGCEGASCTFTVSLTATATALPAGAQSVTSRILGDQRVVLCTQTQVAVGAGTVTCAGEATVTVIVPSTCRLVVIETVGESDRVVSGGATNEVRICKDGSLSVL